MSASVYERAKTLADRAGLGQPLRQLKRRFEPAAVTFDRAEHARLVALARATLTATGGSAIEIGANRGDVLAEIVAAAPAARHLAFEPLPAMAAELRARFPQVDVRAVALSDHTGEEDFAHVTTRPGWSGFRARPTPSADDLVETIRVPVARLDDEVPAGFVPVFVKIDVEGAEREVLAGGAATIAAHRPVVVFEHGLGSADHYGTEPRHLWDLLVVDAGLTLTDLEESDPYTLARFERAFARRERVNFVAR